jgi:hypothetical protein
MYLQICGSFKSAKITVSPKRKDEKIYGSLCMYEFAEVLSPQTITESANRKKYIWSANHKSANSYIVGRSANLKKFKSVNLRNLFVELSPRRACYFYINNLVVRAAKFIVIVAYSFD